MTLTLFLASQHLILTNNTLIRCLAIRIHLKLRIQIGSRLSSLLKRTHQRLSASSHSIGVLPRGGEVADPIIFPPLRLEVQAIRQNSQGRQIHDIIGSCAPILFVIHFSRANMCTVEKKASAIVFSRKFTLYALPSTVGNCYQENIKFASRARYRVS